MKFVCSIGFFLNSARLICRSMDNSKCFRGSLQLRDNESTRHLHFVNRWVHIITNFICNYFVISIESKRSLTKYEVITEAVLLPFPIPSDIKLSNKLLYRTTAQRGHSDF